MTLGGGNGLRLLHHLPFYTPPVRSETAPEVGRPFWRWGATEGIF